MVKIEKEFDTKIYEKNNQLSEKEHSILKEIIKNPRISDQKISQKTKIPVKTVNRKRKSLEEKKLLHYIAYINNFPNGTSTFHSQCMYRMFFSLGTSLESVKKIILSSNFRDNYTILKHIIFDFLGEQNGQAVYNAILVSRVDSDMVEILNAEIVPFFEFYLGKGIITRVEELTIRSFNKFFHNYYIEDLEGKKTEERVVYVAR